MSTITRIYNKRRTKSIDVEDDSVVKSLLKDKLIKKENAIYVAESSLVAVECAAFLKARHANRHREFIDSLALVIDLATQNALPEDTEGELADEAKKQHAAIRMVTDHLKALKAK